MFKDDLNAVTLRISQTICPTRAEGPGTRFAIWVQGCSIRCPGCFNPHLWGATGGSNRSVAQVVEEILDSLIKFPNIEGVTLLGGEPFEQSLQLGILASEIKKHDLSVMTFTGYRFSDLKDEVHEELLAATDLLVDGKFELDNIDVDRPWVGSRNQEFHFLSDRYDRSIFDIYKKDRLELRFQTDGQISVNGWATTQQLETLFESL